MALIPVEKIEKIADVFDMENVGDMEIKFLIFKICAKFSAFKRKHEISDKFGYIYVIADAKMIKNNEYKIGYTERSLEDLRKRYNTYIPSHVVLYFNYGTRETETKIKNKFKRIENSNGNKSEVLIAKFIDIINFLKGELGNEIIELEETLKRIVVKTTILNSFCFSYTEPLQGQFRTEEKWSPIIVGRDRIKDKIISWYKFDHGPDTKNCAENVAELICQFSFLFIGFGTEYCQILSEKDIIERFIDETFDKGDDFKVKLSSVLPFLKIWSQQNFFPSGDLEHKFSEMGYSSLKDKNGEIYILDLRIKKTKMLDEIQKPNEKNIVELPKNESSDESSDGEESDDEKSNSDSSSDDKDSINREEQKRKEEERKERQLELKREEKYIKRAEQSKDLPYVKNNNIYYGNKRRYRPFIELRDDNLPFEEEDRIHIMFIANCQLEIIEKALSVFYKTKLNYQRTAKKKVEKSEKTNMRKKKEFGLSILGHDFGYLLRMEHIKPMLEGSRKIYGKLREGKKEELVDSD